MDDEHIEPFLTPAGFTDPPHAVRLAEVYRALEELAAQEGAPHGVRELAKGLLELYEVSASDLAVLGS